MTFAEYDDAAAATAIYPRRGDNMAYPVLGLCGEAGEVAEKLKKVMRDNGGVIDHAATLAILKELGDVLWYVAAVAFECGWSLEEVAQSNLAKLKSRKERDQLQGSGDNR